MQRAPKTLTMLALVLAGGSILAAQAIQPLSASALGQLRKTEQARVTGALTQLQALRPSLGLDDRSDFNLKNVQTDLFGMTHVRVQQLYQGVPVWGGQAVLHTDLAGNALERTDALVRSIEIDVTPMLEASEALAIVHRDLVPKGAYSEQPTATLVVYPILKELVRPGHESQVNAQDIVSSVEALTLAYHVHTELENGVDPIRHTDYLVDARTGAVLKKWNALQTDAAVGVGNSQYNGNAVPLNTNKLADGTYEFRDLTRGTLPHPKTGEVGNSVRNVNHLATNNYTNMGTIYTDADNLWGDGANYLEGAGELGTNSANGQTAAVDGGFGLASTWDYYAKVHGRNGIDGLGRTTLLRMHIGSNYDNAFWSDSCFCMSYGDGSSAFTLTAIDVAGHEMSHGVTSTTAALTYSGESGGLNEANSDIHGTMVEFYSRNPVPGGSLIGNTGGNWTIGEQLYAGSAMRSMVRPNLDGSSPNYWYPALGTLDVHYSSGPMNRAFYFLSQGATATGDASTSINPPMTGVANANFLPAGMVGIGNDMAAAIWFRAMTAYMTMGTNYLTARQASELAAKDLFGAESPAVKAVRNAFAGINVGLPDGAAVDTIAPVVSASVAGSSGALTLTAMATDNIGVTRVDFYVDGKSVGVSTVPGGPYVLALDSTVLANGVHTVVARAFDAAGNEGDSALVAFNTANTAYHPLGNGDFELGNTGWTGFKIRFSNLIKFGASSLWLGGYGNGTATVAVSSQAYQIGMAIPATATGLTVGFDVWLATTNVTPTNVSVLMVSMSNSPITLTNFYGTFSTLGVNPVAATSSAPAAVVITPGAWVHQTFALDALTYPKFATMKGKTVSIFFNSQEKATEPTNWYIDNVTIDVATPLKPDVTPPVITGVPAVSVTGTTYTFSAAVADETAMARVDYYVDGTAVATSSVAPYTAALDGLLLGNGNHTLVAFAFDATGNVTQSAAVPFTVIVPLPADMQLEQEYNNTLATANPLLPGKKRIQATLPSMLDVDDFAFSIRPGETLTVDMAGPLGSDFDLTLLNASGVAIAASGNAGCTEHLAYTNRSVDSMPVYLRANPYSGPTTVPYFLTPVLTLDATAPTVVATVGGTGTSLILNATATDTGSGVARVEFYVDGLLRGADSTSPYSLAFDAAALSDGVHALTAKAYDPAGNVATSVAVNFTTATTPVATISAMDSAFRGQDGLLAAVPVQVGSTYAWTLAGGTFTSATNGPNVTFSTGTGATADLSVTVTNALGVIATGAKSITLKVPAPAPLLVAGITGSGTSLTFTTTTNMALVQAEYFVDASSKGVATPGPNSDFAFNFDATGLTPGPHALVVKGTDALGNVGASNGLVFTVVAPPVAAILCGDTGLRGQAGLVASVPAQAGCTYVWTVVGGTLTSAADVPNVTFTAGIGATAVLNVTVTNSLGTVASGTKTVTLTGPATAPALTVTVTGDGRNWVFKTASSLLLAQAEYFVDGAAIGVATAGPDYVMHFDASNLAEGSHSLVVKGTDLLGNQGTSNGLLFTVASGPVATITAPSTLNAGSLGQVATAIIQAGATYSWTIQGGTLTSGANGASITYDVGTGPTLTLTLTVTSAAGVPVTATKVISIGSANLDLDGDRTVDAMDLAVFVKATGTQIGDPNFAVQADLNADGKVDAADIKIFLTGLN